MPPRLRAAPPCPLERDSVGCRSALIRICFVLDRGRPDGSRVGLHGNEDWFSTVAVAGGDGLQGDSLLGSISIRVWPSCAKRLSIELQPGGE